MNDNGGEFDNKKFQAILKEEGIIQRLTAPYTPQQNGSSGREMRTIVETARTFKYSDKDVELTKYVNGICSRSHIHFK